MRKTASEIADMVIEKVAISLGKLRELSSGMFQRGEMVRANAYLSGLTTRRAGRYSYGPTVAGNLVPRSYTQTQSALRGSHNVSWPAATGGKGFRLHGLQQNLYSPESQEVSNRLINLHEGLERKYLRQDLNREGKLDLRDSALRWGGNETWHYDPDVLLQESNMIKSLDPKYNDVKNTFTNVRQGPFDQPALEAIQQQYPGFQYGQTRLSRHARRHIRQGLLRN